MKNENDAKHPIAACERKLRSRKMALKRPSCSPKLSLIRRSGGSVSGSRNRTRTQHNVA